MSILTDAERQRISMRYRDVMKEIAEGKRYDNFSYEHAFKAVQYTYKIAEFQSPFIVVAENPCEMQMISNAMRALWKRKTTPFIQNLEDGVAEARKPEPDIEKLELLSKAVFRDALEYIKLVFNGTKVLENSAKRRPHISPDSHSSDPSEDLRHGLHDVIPSRLQQHEMLYLLTCNPKYVSSLSIYTDFYCIWIDEIRNILKQGKNAEKRLNSLLWLKDDEEYQTIWELHRKGGISSIICYPDVAVISKYPKRVYFDLERYSLHRLDGPAIEFGYSDPIFKRDAYYVNHRRILDEWIFDGFTLQEFLSVKNEDTRAAMYEIILSKGNDYCLEFLHAEEVDRKTISHRVSIPVFSPTGEYVGEKEDIQEETLILYRTKFSVPEAIDPLTRKNHAKLAWIRFVCPSTGTNYLISTSPSFDNVIDAAKASRAYDIPDDYEWTQRT